MSLLLIGDVHGEFNRYKYIINNQESESIQLGDLGLGFPTTSYTNKHSLTNCEMLAKHKFIRGNHDNPESCREHPNYLGDYGMYKGIFYISGAWSIDKKYRTIGVDWWPDEELYYTELYKAIDLFKKNKPKIVISHDCPQIISGLLYPDSNVDTRTGLAMDEMLHCHTPDLWIFAHHHRSENFTKFGTEFRCLDILETFYIEI